MHGPFSGSGTDPPLIMLRGELTSLCVQAGEGWCVVRADGHIDQKGARGAVPFPFHVIPPPVFAPRTRERICIHPITTPFSITRTAHTTATPDQVMPLILDFHEWELWCPWEGLDPQLKRSYPGAETGTGARCSWSGNAKAGEGTMEITAATDTSADIARTFNKPVPAKNRVVITVTPSASGGNDLTWTMSGQNTLPARIFFGVFRMEKTLAQLAAVAEVRASR